MESDQSGSTTTHLNNGQSSEKATESNNTAHRPAPAAQGAMAAIYAETSGPADYNTINLIIDPYSSNITECHNVVDNLVLATSTFMAAPPLPEDNK